MAYLMGEGVQLGIGAESTRGTAVTPAIWVPARSPSGIKAIIEKTLIRETAGTGVMTKDSEIVHSRAEGDLEFNVRNTSIGYMLESLMGATTPVTTDGATVHTFTLDGTQAQRPSLTLGLHQPGHQDYAYNMGIVNTLELSTPIDDLVTATASFIAQGEASVSDYTPAFASDDNYFRNHDVTFKLAANVAGLAAATPICLKESSLTIATNTRPNLCVSNVGPNDILSLISEITGSFSVDYEGEGNHDIYTGGQYQAIEIKMIRDDLPVLGTSAEYPEVTITMPKVSFEDWSPDRPLDDIVTEAINYNAHYDVDEGYAIQAVVKNEQATY
jgi:hypothetical protein